MKKVIKRMAALMLTFVMVLGVVPTCDAGAASLSTKEKSYYKNILKNEEFSMPLYVPEFFLYDVNGDGRKDLLVWGAVGSYQTCQVCIYTYDGKKFHMSSDEGSVIGVSKRGVLVDTSNYYYGLDPDYDQYFDAQYDSAYVAKVTAKGNISRVLSKNITTRYTMDEAHKFFNKTSEYKKISGSKETKITKSQYTKLLSKYKFNKSFKAHSLTNANIEKYVK